MKKLVAIALATALVGCGSKEPAPAAPAVDNAQLSQIQGALEDLRSQVMQANDNARQALEIAQQNSEKINRGYRQGQRK